MCYVMYLAAPIPPPLIPFDPDARAFNVRAAADDAAAVARRVLRPPHVVDIGSHTICACGFNVDAGNADGDLERAERETRAAVRALRTYIESLLAASEVIELFVSWTGDERKPARDRFVVGPSYFGAGFTLPEQSVLIVRRDDAQRRPPGG